MDFSHVYLRALRASQTAKSRSWGTQQNTKAVGGRYNNSRKKKLKLKTKVFSSILTVHFFRNQTEVDLTMGKASHKSGITTIEN